MKKMIIRFVFALTAGLLMSGSVSAAVQTDADTIQAAVDRFITQMQQDTIKKNFAALLLKNEMQAKMMTERVPQRFMRSDLQPIIQPVMIEKIRAQIQAQIQAQQMETLTIR